MDSMIADGAKDIHIGKHGGVEDEEDEADKQQQQEEEEEEGLVPEEGEKAGQDQQRRQQKEISGKQASARPRRVAGADVGLDCLEYVPMPLSQV